MNEADITARRFQIRLLVSHVRYLRKALRSWDLLARDGDTVREWEAYLKDRTEALTYAFETRQEDNP